VTVEIRPRTTGEILDDSWRLALADAPLLLLFSTLFQVPAFSAVLLLLAEPAPAGGRRFLLPALAAVLLPLTGLASGACQELFRRRAADEPVQVGNCLRAACRHGLEHAAARAVVLCGIVLGLSLLVMPGLMFWAACTSLHPLLAAGKARTGELFREMGRDTGFAGFASGVVTFSRLPLLLLLILNLHLLAGASLWVAENLAGFDTAWFSIQLALPEDQPYTVALFLLSWLLVTPFFEASNFLLHTDVRTRQEGLDLQYRVQRLFAVGRKPDRSSPIEAARTAREVVRVGLVVVTTAFVLIAPQTAAGATEVETVRTVRQEVETIRDEVEKAEPYPGGQRWQARLQRLSARLAEVGDGEARRVRWFDRAVSGFAAKPRAEALGVLDGLQQQLALLEETLSVPRRLSAVEVKAVLDQGEREMRTPTRREKIQEAKEVRREEVQREEQQPGGHNGPGVEGPGGGPSTGVPVSGGGLNAVGWYILAGLVLVVLIVAAFLLWSSRRNRKAVKPRAEVGPVPVGLDPDGPQPLSESPTELWGQAEKLAGAGQYPEAVRVLYVAILSLLHRQHLIRYEPTRTNGEYVQQVRLSEHAPTELHDPFHDLTSQFERKWYGERPCDGGDYQACRRLAEEIQHQVMRDEA
jgi:hypothetical protein